MVIQPKIQAAVREFPWEAFGDEIRDNFTDIANAYSLPLEFLGTQALFTIAALSGNMYSADVNGGVKPIIFIAKIGPSGVGKTPAFNKICGDIINPLRVKADIDWELKHKDWSIRKAQCAMAKADFTEEEPARIKRVIESGTIESFAKHMLTSHCGFGVIYDEGERFFGEAGKYSKTGGNDTGFWNEVFNGKPMDITRVDSERERFIKWPAISVDIGLQTERLHQYFTSDTIDSGLLNRFLMVESNYITLNENIDAWSSRVKPCESWIKLVTYLFDAGMTYKPGTAVSVQFTDEAKELSNSVANKMTRTSNQVIQSIREGESTKYLAAYRSKLSQYFYRFALILAIYKNPRTPKIDTFCVAMAEQLCEYYEYTARRIINRLFMAGVSNLTEPERELLDELPDSEFTAEIARAACRRLGFSEGFFGVCFSRKFGKAGLVKKLGHGKYQKQ